MAGYGEENCCEGYLEKHGNGPVSLIRGKKKIWCYLIGSNLYCHLENKTSSITSTIDLTQAQMIKCVTSDKTKTQFEITTKFKTFAFTAPSPEDCQTWVKKLQKAMTFEDNLIRHNSSSEQLRTSIMSSSAATGVATSTDSSSTPSVQLNDGYAEVSDFVVQLRGAPQVLESNHYESVTMLDDVFTTSNTQNDSKSRSEKSESRPSIQYATVIPKSQRIETNNNETSETSAYVSVNILGSLSDSDGESIDDIHSFIPDSFPPIPEPQHAISQEDEKPLSELQSFLANNKLERMSSQVNESQDPVQALKSYINSLDL